MNSIGQTDVRMQNGNLDLSRHCHDNGGIPFLSNCRKRTTQETTQMTTQEIAVTTQEKITSDGIKYHFEKLKRAGIISHSGPTKSGHWIVKGEKT